MCYFHLNMEGNDKGLDRVKVSLMKLLYSSAIVNLTRFPHKTNLSQISALCFWDENLVRDLFCIVFVLLKGSKSSCHELFAFFSMPELSSKSLNICWICSVVKMCWGLTLT